MERRRRRVKASASEAATTDAPPPASVPGALFEGDSEAHKSGVYRRSHPNKYVDDQGRLVPRPAVPEFAPTSEEAAAAASHAPDFTVKVVNGVAQVVAKGPKDASELEAAALRSDSLLVAPLKDKAKGKGKAGGSAESGGEIGEAPLAASAEDILLRSAEPAGRRKLQGR